MRTETKRALILSASSLIAICFQNCTKSEMAEFKANSISGQQQFSSVSETRTISAAQVALSMPNAPAQTQPAQTQPAQTQPAQTQPAQTQPAQTQPAQTQPAQTQPAQTQPAQTQPAPPVQKSPFPIRSVYSPTDGKAIINTGVTVSDEVYICLQAYNDGSFPCQNGDLSKSYSRVQPPVQPTSPTQPLLWSSANFYSISGIDFTIYTIFIMSKDSKGKLTNIVGTAKVNFFLPEEALVNGKSGYYASSNGNNVFSYICPVNPDNFTAPAGYQSYPYSNLGCYYKITY